MQAATPESLAEGRFRLLEVIGEGGMATVYRAFDQRLQRPRAIKVLSPALAMRPSLRRRFLAEAQTMANLEESRVVRIFDMGEDGELVYIVMELVEGGSLLDRVRDYGPLPPRMAAEATIQICESLQAAHDAGVIHRDIKPHNILLTNSGEIRITDFGIAQVQSDENDGMTKTGAVMGTWGFMAPEQKSDAKTVDARADVYSVGATLWSLLTGDTPPELFMAETEHTMLQGLPDELAEVVKRSTRYRREERYVSARNMADSLRAFVPLMPEDPELSVPLCPPQLERRPKQLDTMQQFASEMLTGSEASPPQQATMVPNLAGLTDEVASTVAPPTPAEAESPSPAAERPARAPAGTLYTEPKRRSFLPLLAGLGVLGMGALAVIALLVVRPWEAVPSVEPTTLVAPPTPPTATPAADPAPDAVVPDTQAAGVPAVATDTPSPSANRPSSNGKRPAGAAVTAPVAAPPVASPPVASEPVGTPPPVDAAVQVVPSAPSAPAITHTPPAAAKIGGSLPFAAAIPGSGWSVKLYYRPASGGAFQERTMVPSGETYTTSVKVTPEMSAGIAYFISANKGSTTLKVGSAPSPKRVVVVGE